MGLLTRPDLGSKTPPSGVIRGREVALEPPPCSSGHHVQLSWPEDFTPRRMPNVTLHHVLADSVLAGWRDGGPPAPFDLDDAVSLNAFYQGSLGPDIGYFPGGDPFLSDLAHYVDSGRLTRILVDNARTDPERAFAWGWVSHVLGDQAIHPLVGEAVGDFLLGRREFVGAGWDKPHHVRVEVGLDALYSHRNPGLRRRAVGPVFDGRTVRYLAQAYAETYGTRFDSDWVLASHLTAARFARRALASIGVLGSALAAKGHPGVTVARWLLGHTLAASRVGLGAQPMFLVFLNPVPPTEWLVDAVDAAVGKVTDDFFTYLDAGLSELPDYNLDTGDVQEVGRQHPCVVRTEATLAQIRRRRGKAGSRAAPRAPAFEAEPS